jgi:capsule polysaccharide modification protein KpsS
MIILNHIRLNKGKINSNWASGFFPDKMITVKHHDFQNIDCIIQFNIYNPYITIKATPFFKLALAAKKPTLVVEEGAFRNYPQYKRIGWNSYKNGIGNFNNDSVDDTRWKLFQQNTRIKIQNWNSPGGSILIMGQLEFDSALIELYDAGYRSFDQWIEEQIKTIRIYTDRPIIVRPHPLGSSVLFKDEARLNTQYKNISVSKNYSSNTTLSGGIGLQEDLKKSYCVITYNSNSVVEAVEKGIPVFTLSSTSSAYDIGHKDLSKIESLDYNIDISTWCNRIAYTVWNDEEIADGSMWRHLRDTIINEQDK